MYSCRGWQNHWFIICICIQKAQYRAIFGEKLLESLGYLENYSIFPTLADLSGFLPPVLQSKCRAFLISSSEIQGPQWGSDEPGKWSLQTTRGTPPKHWTKLIFGRIPILVSIRWLSVPFHHMNFTPNIISPRTNFTTWIPSTPGHLIWEKFYVNGFPNAWPGVGKPG